VSHGLRPPSRSTRLAPLAALVLLGPACGEGLPDIPLALSKNCTEAVVEVLVPRAAEGHEVLDVAADGALGDSAWVLVRRSSPAGAPELVVQRVAAAGVVYETVLPVDGAAPSLALSPAPETGRVWVVQSEPGRYRVWRVAPDDPVRPLLGSTELAAFPSFGLPCVGCDEDWPRRLFFLPSGPAVVALPRSSEDASLVVWVAELETSGAEIRIGAEHRLNFEPPCDDSTPESTDYCEQMQMSLRYPAISLLGLQQDPRQTSTTLFAHRTRSQSYDGQTFPIESSDVIMVSLSVSGDGVPAVVLRSYPGFYVGNGGLDGGITPMATADPPYGMAIDRFAAYGLFSNGGLLPRLVQLPASDPEFIELTDDVSLTLDTMLLQLDRDIALGHLDAGAWAITKLFPDDPTRSGELRYESDAPIEQVRSGGVGTFMLIKRGVPPEVVRLRCPESSDAGTSSGGTPDEGG
jgi:hypothetical protein